MNWRELAVSTIEKLTEMINEYTYKLNPERITEQIYLKRAVSLSFGKQSINLYNTLIQKGFMMTSKIFVDGFVERIFHTGISISTSFGYLKEALKNSEKLEYVIDNLSDEESKKVFRDFVEFEIIKSFIGESFLYSKDSLIKIADAFDKNIAVRNFVRYKLSSPKLIKVEGDIAEVNTKFGEIKIRKFYSHEVLGEVEYEQYCYSNICVKDGDVVFDIGAFNGITAIYFVKKGAEIVHSFEPLTFEILLETLNLNNVANVVAVNKAISSKNETLYVNAFPGGGIYISRNRLKNTVQMIQAISVDSYVRNIGLNKLDFVKMDIEGWEMEALQGMRGVLRKCRPKIALAAYHKPLDPYKFIKFLEKFGYTEFYLSYNPELVLFAAS